MGQTYSREAGMRAGLTSGFTYRQYLDDYLSYEGILSFRKSGMQVTMIRQIHELQSPFELGQDFHFLYGFGGHAGFFYTDSYQPFGFTEYNYPQRKLSPVVGADAYAAIEYRADTFPLAIGLDFKPFFEFSMYQFFSLKLWDLAFNVRYRF
jgi:hypothetical protein